MLVAPSAINSNQSTKSVIPWYDSFGIPSTTPSTGSCAPTRKVTADEESLPHIQSSKACFSQHQDKAAFKSRLLENCSPSTFCISGSTLLTPYQVSPVPCLQEKTLNRGRKPSKCSVITSSPYKNDLMESLNKPQNKKKLERKKRTRVKQTKAGPPGHKESQFESSIF